MLIHVDFDTVQRLAAQGVDPEDAIRAVASLDNADEFVSDYRDSAEVNGDA